MNMTKEEKQLLIVDLCSRLPYGVICTDSIHGDSKITEINTFYETVYLEDVDEYAKIERCKPYLRPMSSMTDEERTEKIAILWEHEGHINEEITYKYQNWLNAHHLDYRGLIEKKIALKAHEKMYRF